MTTPLPTPGSVLPAIAPAVSRQIQELLAEPISALAHLEEGLHRLLADQSHLASDGELAELRLENERLRDELAGNVSDPSPDGQTELDDLQRRYELACEEIRELRAARVPAILAEGTPVAPGPLDWEEAKRQLLLRLEGADDEGNVEQHAEHLSIQETIERTDRIIAAQASEIELLRQQLSGASQAALAEHRAVVMEEDEWFQEQRQKLQSRQSELQTSWEDKMRKAEIEISIERAKIAREKADIDERCRQLEAGTVHADDSRSATRGRWLARLGLIEE